ncbi:MAG: VOC family protein [Actinomycetota bacterium]|nr:VOC family protein [Actinomycetota bacterium]
MRLDHLSYAAGPEGLASTTLRLAELLGEKFWDGGVHPRFGTRNMVLPLANRQYLEVVEVLDHPASDKAPFGQLVRRRSECGGGWLGWVVAVGDISPVEVRLGRSAVEGNRYRPDGVDLRWRQVGVMGMQTDPELPFFVQWMVPPEDHPSTGATGDVALIKLEIAGDPARLRHWLGATPDAPLDHVDVEWTTPQGTPGVVAAHFATPEGVVRI